MSLRCWCPLPDEAATALAHAAHLVVVGLRLGGSVRHLLRAGVGLHPLLDQFFGPHAYHDARHEWREAAGYALVGVLMLFGSYGFALLIDRRPRRLIAMLEMDR